MTAHCGCGSNATSSNTASQPFGRRSPTDSSRTTTSDAKVPFLRWFQGWDRARVASTSEPVDAHLNGTGALLVQLAFVYRDAAETERQNVPPGRLGSTGVHSPGCSGKGTPVCGRRRGRRGNVRKGRVLRYCVIDQVCNSPNSLEHGQRPVSTVRASVAPGRFVPSIRLRTRALGGGPAHGHPGTVASR